MDYEELRDLLNGLKAYDTGSTDSGIHDPRRKSQAIAYLRSLSGKDHRIILGRIGRDTYLTDEALEYGYGLEDIKGFIEWLDDEGILLAED